MVKQTKTKRRGKARPRVKYTHLPKMYFTEADGVYVLKLIVTVFVATMWLKFAHPINIYGYTLTAIPAGLMIGLIGISLFEKNQLDRKIWYAVLIIVSIITYFVPAGIII